MMNRRQMGQEDQYLSSAVLYHLNRDVEFCLYTSGRTLESLEQRQVVVVDHMI